MAEMDTPPNKILQEIKDCVDELKKEYFANNSAPLTDNVAAVHKLCAKLEYLLQQCKKEQSNILRSKNDLWHFFCQGLMQSKGFLDGLKYVKSSPELKTSIGRSRAFIRYCLRFQSLGDALQHCFSNVRVSSKYFNEDSAILNVEYWSHLVGILYELNDIVFELDGITSDLDLSFPMFSKNSDVQTWALPTRSDSMTSLLSFMSVNESIASIRSDAHQVESGLRLHNRDLSTRLEDATTEVDYLQGQLNEFRAKYHAKITDYEQKCQNLEQLLEDSKKVPPQTETNCQTNSNNLQESLQTANSQIEALKLENQNLLNKNEKLLKDKESESKLSNSLALKIEDLLGKLDKSQRCIIQIKDETGQSLDKANIKNESLQELFKAVECENRRIKLQRNNALQEISDLKLKLEEKEDSKLIIPNSHTNGFHEENTHEALQTPENDKIEVNIKALDNLLFQQEILLKKFEGKYAKSADESNKLKCQTELLVDMLRIGAKREEVKEDFKDEGMIVYSGDNSLLIRLVLNNSKLLNFVQAMKSLNNELFTSGFLHRLIVSKVQEQEKQLFGVTQELEATQKLVSTLKKEHSRLHSAGMIMKDELKEKRKLLNRLKEQLETTHEDCKKVRNKNNESLTEWQNLRQEFASRNKQASEESGFVEEAKPITEQPKSPTEPPISIPIPEAVVPEKEVPDEALPSTSSAVPANGSSPEADATAPKKSRLEILEEQCKLLYVSLVQSSRKSALLDQRLEHILGSSSEEATPTPPNEIAASVSVVDNIPASSIPKTEDNSQLSEPDSTVSEELEEEAAMSDVIEEQLQDNEEQEEIPVDDSDMRRKAREQFVSKIKLERHNSKSLENDLRIQIEELQAQNISLEEEVKLLLEQKNSFSTKDSQYKKRVEFIFNQERKSFAANLAKAKQDKADLEKVVLELEQELQQAKSEVESFKQLLESTRNDLTDLLTSSGNRIADLQSQLETETQQYEKTVKEPCLLSMEQKMAEQEGLFHSLEEEFDKIRGEQNLERGKRRAELEELRVTLSVRDEECVELNEELKKTLINLDLEKQVGQNLKTQVEAKDSEITELDCELQQLKGDTDQLKKKVVQLIKDKDLLWQRTDKLSYIQRIKCSDRWMENSLAKQCLNCRATFTFLLRKHHCRLCGRIFCYNCSNNWILISSSRNRSRVCDDCYNTQNEMEVTTNRETVLQCLVIDSDEEQDDCSQLLAIEQKTREIPIEIVSETSSNPLPLSKPKNIASEPSTSQANKGRESPDEFAVISDEEIVKSLSTCSPYNSYEWKANVPHPRCSGLSTVSSEDLEKNECVTGQVYIGPGNTCALPVLCTHSDFVLGWEIIAEPKGISFYVTYHQESDMKVIVPTTHFKSAEHKLHGELMVSEPGIYTFVFDNKLFKIMAKNIKYTLKKMQLPSPAESEKDF